MKHDHHIVRHEVSTQKGFGWEVVVNRRENIYREYFADTRYGSKQKALEAARNFRDALLDELPPEAPIKFRNTRNKTGVVGVARCKHPTCDGEFLFVAHWPTKSGKPKSRTFSTIKYGYALALELAKEARRQELLKEFGSQPIRNDSLPPGPLLEWVAKRMDTKSKK